LCVIFFNIILIENIENVGAALVFFIPEAILILLLAYRYGIDVVYATFKNWINKK